MGFGAGLWLEWALLDDVLLDEGAKVLHLSFVSLAFRQESGCDVGGKLLQSTAGLNPLNEVIDLLVWILTFLARPSRSESLGDVLE